MTGMGYMLGHHFGTYITKARKQAGFTLRGLAAQMQVSSSTMSRWERGNNTPSRDDVERMAALLGPDDGLMRAWKYFTTPSTLPEWLRNAARLQEIASHVEYVSPTLVPGPLQSPLYAEVVFKEGLPLTPVSEIEELVSARCGRLAEFREQGDPDIAAVFPVSALTCMPESVRREQAAHLLGLERVTVHVVPEGFVLIGVTSPLVMVRLPSGERAASSDHISGNVIFDQTTDFARLSELVKRAYASALPPSQSRQLLEEMR